MNVKCPFCRFWFKTEDELAMHLYPTHKFEISLPFARVLFKINKKIDLIERTGDVYNLSYHRFALKELKTLLE